DAVRTQRVIEILQLLPPLQPRVHPQRHVLPDLARLVRVAVPDPIRLLRLSRVIGLRMTDLGQRRKLACLLVRHLHSPRRIRCVPSCPWGPFWPVFREKVRMRVILPVASFYVKSLATDNGNTRRELLT